MDYATTQNADTRSVTISVFLKDIVSNLSNKYWQKKGILVERYDPKK